MLVDIVGAGNAALHDQLSTQIGALQKDVTLILDRLDVVEEDTSTIRRHLARVLRERSGDARHGASMAKRIRELEGRLDKAGF